MKLFLVAIILPSALLSACIEESDRDERPHHPEHHGATLPNDAYYIGVPLPFRSVEDCTASRNDPSSCFHAVALCASGAYGLRHGDVVDTGRYHLDDRHAVSQRSCRDGGDDEDGDSARFDFDVEAGQLVTDQRSAIVWEPDFDGRWKTEAGKVIDCSARPPRR